MNKTLSCVLSLSSILLVPALGFAAETPKAAASEPQKQEAPAAVSQDKAPPAPSSPAASQAPDSQKPKTPYEEAIALAEKGQYEEALKKLNEVLIKEPGNVDAYFHRGMILFQQNDAERALNDFHKALDLNPKFAPAYVGEATVVFSKGELDKAIEFLNKAIEADPKFGLAYHNRGVARYYQAKYDEALKDLNKAIELGFEVDRDVYEQVSALSDLDATIEKLSKEIKANPDDGVNYYNRGIAYYHKGEYKKALDDINAAKARQLPFPIEDDMVKELERLSSGKGTPEQPQPGAKK